MSWRKMPMKYPGTCIVCGKGIEVNETGLWAKGQGVKHVECDEPAELACVVCGKPAGCRECEFQDICDIPNVSPACLCKGCSEGGDPVATYRRAAAKKFPALSRRAPGGEGAALTQTKLI